MSQAGSERVLVLGTGAMGSLFAACLAGRGGFDVTVGGSWPEGLAAIAADGVTVEEPGGTWTARVDARPVADLARSHDLVLVLTKSWKTAAVAPVAARAVADQGLVLTLQNGLGNREILAAAAGGERVAAGVTGVGATLLGPGRVRLGGCGRTVIGDRGLDHRRLDRGRLDWAARALEATGFTVELTGDLPRAQWTKLAVNCALNPLTALSGLTNGRLVAGETWRRELEAAAREVGRVAAAKGIGIEVDLGHHALGVARATARNRSSMLQDVQSRRPTEIEALNGAVVAEGQRMAVPTPVNALLAERIRDWETRALVPPATGGPR